MRKPTTRRQFVRMTAMLAGAAIIQACAPAPTPTPVPPPKPAEAPKPAAPAPTATTAPAKPTEAPKPAAPTPTTAPAKPAEAPKPTAAPAPAAKGPSAPKPPELNVVGWADLNKHMTGNAARFQEQYGVKATYTEAPAKWNELVLKYTNWLQSGYDGMDVYLLDDFVVAQYSVAGWVLKMDDYFTKDELADWVDPVRTMWGFTGGMYRLPVYFGITALYYRKDILESEGVAVPQTWQELIEAGKKLTKGDRWGWLPQADTGNQNINFTIQQMWQGGGDPKVLDDEGCRKGLQMMWDIIHTHKITPQSITTYGGAEIRAMAKEGKAAMWWDFEGGLNIVDAADSPIKGKVGVADWPAGPGGRWAMCHSWGFGVSKFSKHRDWAVEYAKFATAPKQMRDFQAILGGRPPARKSILDDQELVQKVPFTPIVQKYFANRRFRIIDIPNPIEVHDVIGKAGSFVMTKQKTVDEAAKWGGAEMKKVLKK